jgi:hypothetical protein
METEAPKKERAKVRPYVETGEDDSGDQVATVFLRGTYQAHGEEIDRIELHEYEAGPCAKACKGKSGMELVNAMIAHAAGIPLSTVSRFKARDQNAAIEALQAVGFPTEQ